MVSLLFKIFQSVFCVALSFLSIYLPRKGLREESELEIIKCEREQYISKILAVLFLFPLISLWFPEYTQICNLIYISFVLILFIIFIIPKIRDDEEQELLNKKNKES